MSARPALHFSDGAAGPVLLHLAPDPRDVRWQGGALCAQVDPEMWFPEKGETGRYAKAICRLCPVRAACLDYAMEHDLWFGIYGGLHASERRELARERKAA